MASPTTITFVTSNTNKFNEVKSSLPEINIIQKDADLIEIQDTQEEIVKYKCAQAAHIINGPVLVEDTSLEFNALGGLPGPYIKHFCKSIGGQGLHNILEKYEDKSARAICYLAFTEGPNKVIYVFKGLVDGKITEPQGPSSFDWDNIFIPNGYDKTFSELGSVKNEISHRRKSANLFARFIVSQLAKSLNSM